MVTKTSYIQNIIAISKLFCKDQANKMLCEASIVSRLTQNLTDETFPKFLEKLSSGRQYITTVEQLQNKGFRIVIVDVITGQRDTAWWTHSWNLPYFSKIPTILLSHQFNIISSNKTYNNENWSQERLTWNPIKESYGIVFVPSGGGEPSGGEPGGGGGTIQTIPPTQTQGTTPTSGFDIKSLLENPMVLIGVGLLAVYLIMKK